jgi:mannose-6-phosphate isomerase-like protein (cupin superfamily)
MTKTQNYPWVTIQLPEKYDYPAPDGSEIRLLPQSDGGGMAHCTLPARSVSRAVYHKNVDEIWYFISGSGEVWRKKGKQEEVVTVGAGTSLNILCGTSFQFRNTSTEPLCFVIATIPPWPGQDEAVLTSGRWSV